jgi:hypothetical protein
VQASTFTLAAPDGVSLFVYRQLLGGNEVQRHSTAQSCAAAS